MNTNPELPEGYALFINPLEYAIGMPVMIRIGKSDWRMYSSPEFVHFAFLKEGIEMGTIAYQKLTLELIEGEKAWWSEEAINKVKAYTFISSIKFSHGWQMEQMMFNNFKFDLTKYRTHNHPQYNGN